MVECLASCLRLVLPPRAQPDPALAASPAPILQRLMPRRISSERGCAVPLFRPYVASVPWHGGVRGFLSQLFPRYGHYCGPNWSSGKDGGSMLWDQRPVDWLDFCCYCHDIGYDTYDQAKLVKADLAFLECLEQPRMASKGGGAPAAIIYRAMCIAEDMPKMLSQRNLMYDHSNDVLSISTESADNKLFQVPKGSSSESRTCETYMHPPMHPPKCKR